MKAQQPEQNTPKSTNKAKRNYHPRAWWFQHYQAWQASGVSKTQYCKDQDISLSSFCNWSAEFSSTKNQESPSPPKPPAFIKAVITPEANPTPTPLVKTLGFQEITLTFEEGLTKSAVAEWIATLRSLTC